MMKIALTGGIGSGKSFVCQQLKARGISVYDCDAGAKHLLRSSPELQHRLQQLIGQEVYIHGVLQKAVLAKYLLASAEHAQEVDDIIHPAVAQDFELSGMQWLESAIFFDSGFCHRVHIDKVVCVVAPQEVRIARVMARDGISCEKTLEWINRQLPQEEVQRRSDFTIVNDGEADIDEQLDTLLNNINKKQ